MKTWQVRGPGRDCLKLAEIPRPSPGTGEVLVRVHAVSLNYRDRLSIDNNGYASYGLPFTPCSDLAGEIEALGAGVSRFTMGERVINNFNTDWMDGPPPRIAGVVASFGGPVPGVLAEYVVVPEAWLVKAPESLSYSEASTLPCCGLTAWTSLVELGRIRPGEIVVVQGTGGMSIFAIQLAAAAGAEVIVTSSSDAKLARAKALGARHGINRTTSPDWAAAVLELTGGRGADHILEMAGGDNLANSVRAIAPGGRISLIGVIDSFNSSFPSVPAILAQATIQAIYVGHRRGLQDLVRAVDRIGLKPVIEAEFEFADFLSALDVFAKGPFGKVVITVGR
ncbi:NADPH:quinone reductase-like Zn-dependent oxidoreductase [Bradyrhizobium sp. USDA 372]